MKMEYKTMARVRALDLFAGTGWGVACKRLGIKEQGVEIMEEAVQTRTANGMETIYRDVWDGLELTREEHRNLYGSYGLLIASPPCQTFSMAGHGAGRAALDEVIEAIALHAYKDAAALRDFGERHDMRTALVLSPLAYVWRDMPKLVAMEQVPTVLPVWEACAEVMREWGYEVKVEVLNAEQYGVPQTRKRAILVARRGGPVQLPVPTHSRYYPRTPDKLDPGVQKWASMAEALGWGFTQRPQLTLTGHGFLTRGTTGQQRSVMDAVDRGEFAFRPPYTAENAGKDPNGPSLITRFEGGALNATVEENALLQSYPPYVAFTQNNKQAHQARRTLDQPAPTVTAGHDSTNRGFFDKDGGFTIAEPEQVAALQTYPEPAFIWCGSKSKKFLQIGNAVPPVLAEAVLAALIGIREGR